MSAPTLDDVSSDVSHLAHILDVILETTHNLDVPASHTMDRLCALIWIGRDMAERARDDIERASKTRKAGAA